ncbi:hypothetical protein EDB80DRAFT_828564 [Ilyonectria destructans]|nr:hypothetical protein EDB80DRAFT_828564 [Ilyonectria destructans]
MDGSVYHVPEFERVLRTWATSHLPRQTLSGKLACRQWVHMARECILSLRRPALPPPVGHPRTVSPQRQRPPVDARHSQACTWSLLRGPPEPALLRNTPRTPTTLWGRAVTQYEGARWMHGSHGIPDSKQPADARLGVHGCQSAQEHLAEGGRNVRDAQKCDRRFVSGPARSSLSSSVVRVARSLLRVCYSTFSGCVVNHHHHGIEMSKPDPRPLLYGQPGSTGGRGLCASNASTTATTKPHRTAPARSSVSTSLPSVHGLPRPPRLALLG